jgi:hypothetical protein
MGRFLIRLRRVHEIIDFRIAKEKVGYGTVLRKDIAHHRRMSRLIRLGQVVKNGLPVFFWN